mmetsp:Transcript_112361/g.317558  ORF Transcript_112361/g.317558 Transcript_112361/m.317558 type:complete len:242 (+) Transcript_112361:175-900(+)
MVLQRRYALVDLLVPLPERLELFEGRRDHAPDMAQGLAVLRELQRESKVGVAKHTTVRQGVDELEAPEPAEGGKPWCRRQSCDRRVVVIENVTRGVVNHVLQRPHPIEVVHDIAQLLVREIAQRFFGFRVELKAVPESLYGIRWPAVHELPLPRLADVPGDLLGTRLPLVPFVGEVLARQQLRELVHGQLFKNVLHHLVLLEAPLRQYLVHLRCLLRPEDVHLLLLRGPVRIVLVSRKETL